MALVVNTNSYISLEEADDYAWARQSMTDWQALPNHAKEQTLVSAADYLNTIPWAGVAADTVTPQKMSFPRIVKIWHPRYGAELSLDGSTVPQEIKDAQVELAVFIFTSGGFGGTAKQGGAITGNPSLVGTPEALKVGSISLEGLKSDGASDKSRSSSVGYMLAGVSLPPVVYKMLEPYLTASAPQALLSGLNMPYWRAW